MLAYSLPIKATFNQLHLPSIFKGEELSIPASQA